ncbi:hypothetical protein [Pimelobacter simplex]|uniref:hypothetical protein n=1 Tax=Nocardioides simplex TaxID=2045 RepID=UPI003AAF9C3D
MAPPTVPRRTLSPAFVALALAAGLLAVLGVAAPASAAPTSVKSFYVSRYSLSWAYDRGCDAGRHDLTAAGAQRRYVVLDFGAMYKNASGTWMLTAFSGADISFPQARDMVAQWARGYWVCVGSDVESVAYVALGTNNSNGQQHITAEAGRRLAGAAKNAYQITTDGVSWYRQARPVGGNDFEDWGRPAWLNGASRAWIDGYNGVSGARPMLNYGAAGGCPTSSVPGVGSCNAGLNAETIWRVSWSGTAYPLPEVYASSGANAKQWRYLSKYAVTAHGSKFFFPGVMAQSGACSQSAAGCPGTGNGPGAAWNQLDTQVNADPATATTPGSPTNIWWGPR